MSNFAAAAGVFLLAAFAPFEMTTPLVRLPRQAVTNLEALLALALGVWAVSLVAAGRLPSWRAPVTRAWCAFLAAAAVAAALAPVEQSNAWHMCGRLMAAASVYLLTVDGMTDRGRVRIALALAVLSGVVVAMLAILEYWQVESVMKLLRAFRPGLSSVGAQVRATGTLQYPTIASMYLEVAFAFGLGLVLFDIDRRSWKSAIGWLLALLLIAEAVILTFTRAGLITLALAVAILLLFRIRERGIDLGSRAIAALSVAIVALAASSRSMQSTWLRLSTEGQDAWYRARVEAPPSLQLSAGEERVVPVEVTNTGLVPWDPFANPPMRLSYHWLMDDGERVVTFDGERSDFPEIVEPGARVSLQAFVRAPLQPGDYRLEWDVVQEGLLWFSTEQGAPQSTISAARVAGAARHGRLTTWPRPAQSVRPGRQTLWTAALRMTAAHPFVGVGPDNFRLLYGPYVGLATFDRRTHSNNMYLEVLAGGGVVAAAAFAWLVWQAARVFARAGAAADPLAWALVAAGVAIAVHGVVDSFLSFAPTYILFAMTLGYAASLSRGAEPVAHADSV